MPSLSSFCAVVNPGMPRSMMNAVMPRELSSRIERRVDDQHVGNRSVRDPHFRCR